MNGYQPKTVHCDGPPPHPPKGGSSGVKPAQTIDALEVITRLFEAQTRAYEGFCEVNLKMLKAESKLNEIIKAISDTNKGAERSEFHRGWCGACDMMQAILRREQ